MPAIDLDSFSPGSASELLDGILSTAVSTALDQGAKLKATITADLKALSIAAFGTQARLATGEIDQSEADFLLHMQELNLNSILLKLQFLTYALAQAVLDAVFGLIRAAVRNLTGFDLNF
jgi:hypothetical protein